MILKIQLRLCLLAFFVNALNANQPAALVLVVDNINGDFLAYSEAFKYMIGHLIYGRIHIVKDLSSIPITNQVATGQWRKTTNQVTNIWDANQARQGYHSICEDWKGSGSCSIHFPQSNNLIKSVRNAFGKFQAEKANLFMMSLHNTMGSKDFGDKISEIRRLLLEYKITERTNVFVISEFGGNPETEGLYFAFGPHIPNLSPPKHVYPSCFYPLLCKILEINCESSDLDKRCAFLNRK